MTRAQATKALRSALSKKDYVAARAAIEAGADVMQRSRSGAAVFHRALFDNAPEDLLDLMVQAGADVNAPLHRGDPLILFAASSEDTANVRFLIKHGANPNPPAKDGYSMMHRVRNPEMVHYLCSLGLPINTRTSSDSGWTPLIGVAAMESPETVAALLQHGADPNIAAHDGDTALSQTVRHIQYSPRMMNPYRRMRIAGILLDAGANPHARSPRGEVFAKMFRPLYERYKDFPALLASFERNQAAAASARAESLPPASVVRRKPQRL